MMAASRTASKANAELPLVDVQTGKDMLYNDLILFTKSKSLKWNSGEIWLYRCLLCCRLFITLCNGLKMSEYEAYWLTDFPLIYWAGTKK